MTKIEIPNCDAYPNDVNDYVSYDYNQKGNKPTTLLNQPCYSRVTSMYSNDVGLRKYDLMLHTNANRNRTYGNNKNVKFNSLSDGQYLCWINLCRKHGLVTVDAEAFCDSKTKKLKIAMGHSRSRVYSSLCCYRWSDSKPAVCHRTIELYLANKSNINFFQAFHYSLATLCGDTGHSFCHINTHGNLYSSSIYAGDGYRGYKDAKLGLLYSIVMARYFLADQADKADDNTLVTNQIQEEYNRFYAKFGDSLQMSSLNYILDPEISVLYERDFDIEDKNKVLPIYKKSLKKTLTADEKCVIFQS